MTQDRFPRAFALLKVHEGGYSNHPRDPGGATMKGVTQRTYDGFRRRTGQGTKDVRLISKDEVERIYREQYWTPIRADELPPGLAYCVFDAAVNSGPGRAARWLQAIVGVRQDGIIGNETLGAVRGRIIPQIIISYCDQRLAFMKRLKHWPAFKNGWTRRVEEVRAQSLKWADDMVPMPSKEPVQAKAEGPEKASAVVSDMLSDKGSLGAIAGLVGSAGALASGAGPVQYAIAAALILGAVAGIWWLVKGRSSQQ